MASTPRSHEYVITELKTLEDAFYSFLESKSVPDTVTVSLVNDNAEFIHVTGWYDLGIFNTDTDASTNPDKSSEVWKAAFSAQRCIDILRCSNLSDQQGADTRYVVCFGEYVGTVANPTEHGLGFHVLLVGQMDNVYTYEANLEDFFPPTTEPEG